ncbi:DUF4179 domain-containing protein [Clostridium sp. A1-XYC3]|uniref:DUF4179 domain-containing protein n=1 Tax=Clostridium tanneri TaxID=3037988 RepID=A0ABU4JY37_9CLOT|nr:DUF4179 domain-containing protein [Clostridium sp. A1-XYC3]MDW8803022.1 DUF4179 domain-containing protein [Clostridium sp. A1-XYC3]
MQEMLSNKEIIELLKKCKDMDIPAVVDNKIEDTYKIIKRNKDKRKIKGYAAAAALILTIGAVGGTLYNNPALAYEIPGVKTLVSKTSLFKDEKLSKYATPMEAKCKDKGIELRIKEVVYDGSDIYIAYIVKSDKALKIDEDKIYGSAIVPVRYNGREIKVIGSEVNEWEDMGYEKVDDNTYIVKERLGIESFRKPINEIGFEEKINKLAGIEGNWQLNFKINVDSMKDKIKAVKVNKNVDFGYGKLKITDLQISPIKSRIVFEKWNFTFNNDNEREDTLFEKNYNFVISDDKGRGLQKVGGGSSTNQIKSKGEERFNTAGEEIPKFIVITPVKRTVPLIYELYQNMNEEDVNAGIIPKEIINGQVSHGTLDKLPAVINTEKFGKIIINKIEEKEENAYIYLTIEQGKYLSIFDSQINIYDKTKDRNNRKSYYGSGMLERVKDNDYVLRIDKDETRETGKIDFNRLKDYEVVTPDFDEGYELVGKEMKIEWVK